MAYNFFITPWSIPAMRSTYDLDEKVLNAVVAFTGAKSKSKAVEMALEEFLRHHAIQRFLARAGTMPDFMKDIDYKAERALSLRRDEKLHGPAHSR